MMRQNTVQVLNPSKSRGLEVACKKRSILLVVFSIVAISLIATEAIEYYLNSLFRVRDGLYVNKLIVFVYTFKYMCVIYALIFLFQTILLRVVKINYVGKYFIYILLISGYIGGTRVCQT